MSKVALICQLRDHEVLLLLSPQFRLCPMLERLHLV